MPRVERALDGRQRERTALRNLERHGPRLFLQLGVGHHLVDEAPLQRLLRRQPDVAEPHLLGALLADQVFQVPGAVAGIERAHHRPDLAEDRALLGDGEVAHAVQHVPAADREAVHGGDHRLLQLLDRLIHLQRRQHAGVEVGVLHAVLAPADAEELVAGAGQHDHARARLAPDGVDAVADLVARHVREHVAVMRPVERDGADRARLPRR